MDQSDFHDAAASLRSAHLSGITLCQPFVTVLPGVHAAVSTFGATFGDETLCASDEVAGRLDELQIDLGEGPSWLAVEGQRPVLEPDIHRKPSPWPVFAEAISEMPTKSLFAFPLTAGRVELGALGLYADGPEALTGHDVATIKTLADIVATQVLRRTFSRMDAPAAEEFSRREVHQATGMVVAQLGISAVEALLIIRAHAYASNKTVRDLSAEIIQRQVNLSEF